MERDPRDPEVARAFGRIKENGGKVLRIAHADRSDGRYILSGPLRREADAEAKSMRVAYDPTADAMDLYLTERAPEGAEIARTEEVAAGVTLGFDGAGRVIGIEVLSVSKLAEAKPMQMAFEILTRSDAAAAE